MYFWGSVFFFISSGEGITYQIIIISLPEIEVICRKFYNNQARR